MRRTTLGMLTLPLLIAGVLVVGCSKDSSKSKGKDKGDQKEGKKESKEQKMKPLSAEGGVVKGKIRLSGARLDLQKMTDQLRAEMNRKPELKDVCGEGESFEHEQFSYRIGENKQVGNVFVWLEPEKDHYFKVEDNQLRALKEHPVVTDQPHCAFVPHCAIYIPEVRDPDNPKKHNKTGQTLILKNSSRIPHHPSLAEWDETIPPGEERKPELKPEPSEHEIQCKIHLWMRAYLRTFDHPYATLSLAEPRVKHSDSAFGSYEIRNTPTGRMRILAWHENAGFLNSGGEEGEVITINDNGPTEKNFDLKVK